MAKWLFYNRDTSSTTGIEFESQYGQGPPRKLKIMLGDALAIRRECPSLDKLIGFTLLEGEWFSDRSRIVLRTVIPGQTTMSAFGVLKETGMLSNGNLAARDGGSVFIGSCQNVANEEAKAFSDIEVANRQDAILPSLRLLEPRLKRMALILQSERPVVHADIGLKQLVPITFMGEGVRRLLAILSAIATTPSGRVLIDEIENGFHHSMQKQVWQAISMAARQNNVQIFATTHSYECIQAAHAAFSESGPYDFRLFRLDRREDKITLAKYDREMVETAIDMNWEVR